MSLRPDTRPDRWAPYLLVGALAVVVLLAGLSIRSTYAHRTAACQLMHDYAQLAAERLLDAANRQLNFYCFYPAYYYLLDTLGDPATEYPPPADPNANGLSRQQRQALASIEHFRPCSRRPPSLSSS